jgi:putative two-component system response regulator
VRLLLADDNQFYRVALEATLKQWGYEVISVADGAAALDVLLSADAPKMAILDWMMPKASGLEVCRKVREQHRPEPAYIIMITAKGGKQNIITALENGADDYITKPCDREELQARLQVGRRIVSLQTSETVVYAFARAVEAKSPYTQGHADRVAAYAVALAERVGVSKPERELLRRGAVLHDIGKISLPDAVLNKEGQLTKEEFDLVKQHPMQGVRMIGTLQSLADVIPMIRSHHERLDGSGYPDGLRGDAIPLLVRILSIADGYDAMSSARPYRDGLPHAECLRRLQQDVDAGRLDARLVAEFARLPLTPLAPAGRPALGHEDPSGSISASWAAVPTAELIS